MLFKCEYCPRVFSLKNVLTRHVRTSHDGLRYTCNLCNKQFTRMDSLKNHENTVQGQASCVKNKDIYMRKIRSIVRVAPEQIKTILVSSSSSPTTTITTTVPAPQQPVSSSSSTTTTTTTTTTVPTPQQPSSPTTTTTTTAAAAPPQQPVSSSSSSTTTTTTTAAASAPPQQPVSSSSSTTITAAAAPPPQQPVSSSSSTTTTAAAAPPPQQPVSSSSSTTVPAPQQPSSPTTTTGAAPPQQPSSSSSSSSPTEVQVYCKLCDLHIHKKEWAHHVRTNAHKTKCANDANVINNIHGFTSLRSLFSKRIETLVYHNKDEERLDISAFLKEVEDPLMMVLAEMLTKHNGVKWNIEVFCEYIKMVGGEEEESSAQIAILSHQAKMCPLTKSMDAEESYRSMCGDILSKSIEFQERDSGWTLVKILHVEVNINKYQPLKGSSYVPLPPSLLNKKACVNVKNNDVYCFKWGIISAIKQNADHVDRPAVYKISNISAEFIPITRNGDDNVNYVDSEIILNFSGMSFPLELKQIPLFEKKNPHISVNVFGYDYDVKGIVGPYHITKEEKRCHINLLLLQTITGDKSHYVWIKDISR